MTLHEVIKEYQKSYEISFRAGTQYDVRITFTRLKSPQVVQYAEYTQASFDKNYETVFRLLHEKIEEYIKTFNR